MIRRTKPAKNDSHITFTGTFAESNDDFSRIATESSGTVNVKALNPGQIGLSIGCQRGVVNLETASAFAASIDEAIAYAKTMAATPKSGPHFTVKYRDARGQEQTIGPFTELEYIDDVKSSDFDTVLCTWAPWAEKAGQKHKIAGSDFVEGTPQAS